MKVLRSALRTSRLYPQETFLVLISENQSCQNYIWYFICIWLLWILKAPGVWSAVLGYHHAIHEVMCTWISVLLQSERWCAAFLYVVVGWCNHMMKQDDRKFSLPCHESEELSLALSLQGELLLCVVSLVNL